MTRGTIFEEISKWAEGYHDAGADEQSDDVSDSEPDELADVSGLGDVHHKCGIAHGDDERGVRAWVQGSSEKDIGTSIYPNVFRPLNSVMASSTPAQYGSPVLVREPPRYGSPGVGETAPDDCRELQLEIREAERALLATQSECLSERIRADEAARKHQRELSDLTASLDELDTELSARHSEQFEEEKKARLLVGDVDKELKDVRGELASLQAERELAEVLRRGERRRSLGAAPLLQRVLDAETHLAEETDALEMAAEALERELRLRLGEGERLSHRTHILGEELSRVESHVHAFKDWSSNVHGELEQAASELRASHAQGARERSWLEQRAAELECVESPSASFCKPPAGRLEHRSMSSSRLRSAVEPEGAEGDDTEASLMFADSLSEENARLERRGQKMARENRRLRARLVKMLGDGSTVPGRSAACDGAGLFESPGQPPWRDSDSLHSVVGSSAGGLPQHSAWPWDTPELRAKIGHGQGVNSPYGVALFKGPDGSLAQAVCAPGLGKAPTPERSREAPAGRSRLKV